VKRGNDPKAISDDEKQDAKNRARLAMTVKEVADEYWEANIKDASLSYRRSAHIEMRDYLLKPFGNKGIQQITTSMLVDVLKPTWKSKHATAKRALAHIWGVFEHAISLGPDCFKGGNPADKKRMKRLLADPNDFYEVKHHPSLPFEQIGQFMEKFRAYRIPQFKKRQTRSRGLKDGKRYGAFVAVRRAENDDWHYAQWLCRCDCGKEKVVKLTLLQRGLLKTCGCHERRRLAPGPWSDHLDRVENLSGGKRTTLSLLIEFVALTAVRGGEARVAQWKEIDGDMWNVPAQNRKGRKKQKREGKVRPIPITPAMHNVLEEMRRRRTDLSEEALIFPQSNGRAHAESNVGRELKTICKAIGWPIEITVHGFRNTLRDWSRHHNYPPYLWLIQAGQKAGTIFDAVGGVIQHHRRGTDDAYGRGNLFERRREMMEHWARCCSGPPAEPERSERDTNVVDLSERMIANARS
jgi:integrase-like protein